MVSRVLFLTLCWLKAGAISPAASPPRPSAELPFPRLETRPGSLVLSDDPQLRKLVERALDQRPELKAARARMVAEEQRAPQTQSLPDPVVSLGMQNDGFRQFQVGRMETSWISIGAAQSMPWFGVRAQRASVAEVGTRVAESESDRTRLGIRAEIELGYLGLIAVRDGLDLLRRLDRLWDYAEGVARVRYESGDGTQGEWLRAQLERSRLRRQQIQLKTEEQRRLVVLARLSGGSADDPTTTVHLVDLADPVLPDLRDEIARAHRDSPEAHRSEWEIQRAERQLSLSRTSIYPDVTVAGGLMYRGQLEPMWSANLSFGLPVWSRDRQTHALSEARARRDSAQAARATVLQQWEQTIRERRLRIQAALDSNHLYRSGLLVQSEASTESALIQYRVGKAPFGSVLEALTGYVSDMNGFFQSLLDVQQLAIAERELVFLDAGSSTSLASTSGAGMGAASAMGASPGAPSTGTSADSSSSDAGNGSPRTNSMTGM